MFTLTQMCNNNERVSCLREIYLRSPDECHARGRCIDNSFIVQRTVKDGDISRIVSCMYVKQNGSMKILKELAVKKKK